MNANIVTCAKCPFSISVSNERGVFKFMCGFKKVWYKIPASLFLNIWLEDRQLS